MEVKAYIEGIMRKWWILAIILVVSFLVGKTIGDSQIYQYVASTSIMLNGPMLSSTAFNSNVVQLSTPLSFESQVITPATLNFISKHYPRLSRQELQKNISVTIDKTHQILLIRVTDSKPEAAADIANYLGQRFVTTQRAELERQLNYYQNWLQKTIPPLENEINSLTTALQTLIPDPTNKNAPPVDRTTQRTIVTDQYRLDIDEHNLYNYQQGLQEVQNVQPLLAKSYVILNPATSLGTSVSFVLPTPLIELIAVLTGLLLGVILLVALDYFSPFVRHKEEVQRIVGLFVLAELPGLFRFEQSRLLAKGQSLSGRKGSALRLASTLLGAPAMKSKGYTVVLTSSHKKYNFSAILATLLARSGQQTLLIDANFTKPSLPKQLVPTGVCEAVTRNGLLLSFIKRVATPHLFILPATASITQNDSLRLASLLELLPELQALFDIIIIDAPPIDCADTHLLATKAAQTVLLTKKRSDSLDKLKVASIQCQQLKLNAYGLLLG